MLSFKKIILLTLAIAAFGYILIDTAFRQEMGFPMPVNGQWASGVSRGISGAVRSRTLEVKDLAEDLMDRLRIVTDGR